MWTSPGSSSEKKRCERPSASLRDQSSASATMPKPHRTGFGRPGRITVSPRISEHADTAIARADGFDLPDPLGHSPMPSSSPRSGASIARRSMPVFCFAIWCIAAGITGGSRSTSAPAASLLPRRERQLSRLSWRQHRSVGGDPRRAGRGCAAQGASELAHVTRVAMPRRTHRLDCPRNQSAPCHRGLQCGRLHRLARRRSRPNWMRARRSVEWIVEDANRASEVIRRIEGASEEGRGRDFVPLDLEAGRQGGGGPRSA